MIPHVTGPESVRLALGAREAADSLDISEGSLMKLVRAGKVPHMRLGERVVFPVAVLQEWMRTECEQWLASDEGAA